MTQNFIAGMLCTAQPEFCIHLKKITAANAVCFKPR